MAYEYEAIAALNRMLESKERREQTKLSHALAMMQFAQQQKMQDYSMAANQIAVLQQANEQMKISHASQFVADLGLEAFDLEDDDGLSAARKYLTKKIRYSKRTGVNKGGLGLTDVQANQLLSDVMAYRSGNASPILSTASDLSDIADKQSMKARGLDVKIGGEEHRLFSAFQTGLGYFDDVESATKKLGSIRQSLQNEEDIIREQFELAQGDTEISKKIGGYGMDELAGAAETFDAASPITENPEKELYKVSNSLDELDEEVTNKQQSLSLMETELESLEELKRHGKLSDEQEEYLNRIPDIRENLENDILELSDQIEKTTSLESMLKESKRELPEKESRHGLNPLGPAFSL